MTDEAESRVDGGAAGERAPGETSGSPSDDPQSGASDLGSEHGTDGQPPNSDGSVDFGDLSIPQRVFVAAVQNPTRGVVIVGLFAFAFSFYIAFWMVFPRVAAFMSGVGLVLVGIMTAVYLFSR